MNILMTLVSSAVTPPPVAPTADGVVWSEVLAWLNVPSVLVAAFALVIAARERRDNTAMRSQQLVTTDVATLRRLAAGHRHDLDRALATLDDLNDIACKVIAGGELLTEARKKELGLADLAERIGNIGSRLPEPLRDLVEGCDSTGSGVHHWAVTLNSSEFDYEIGDGTTDAVGAGRAALAQHEAAVELDKAIDAARAEIRKILEA